MGDSQVGPALRWLAHPVSVAALGVLALNDHVLKGALGTWWTGKLSDVAGLVFFPALVAVVLAALARAWRTPLGTHRPSLGAHRPPPDAHRLTLVAVTLTGVGFVWVKATWTGAAAASAVLSALAGPSVVRADATDLLALPALGLAAWTAGRVPWRGAEHVGAGERWQAARRAFAVAMVPLALLGSVATGGALRPEASVIDDGAGGWLVVGWMCEGDHCADDDAYRLTPDGWELTPPPAVPWSVVDEACLESDPEHCFRTTTERMGVDESRDGGATWEVAWAPGDDDVRALREAYGRLGNGGGDRFVGSGVGVFEDERGATVVVANGIDGLLMRGPDGHWRRVAFEGLDCCDNWQLVPLPTRWLPYGAPVPPAMMWGAAVVAAVAPLTLLLAGAGVTGRRGASDRDVRWVAGAFAVAVALASATCALFLGPLGHTIWPSVDVGVQSVAVPGAAGACALVGSPLAFALLGGWWRGLWWRVGLAACVVGVVAGAAVYAVPGVDGWDAAVAVAVAAPGTWAAARWLRR